MNTPQRFEAVAYAPRAELGDAAARPLERVSTRPAAGFDEYVLVYARAQRFNVSLIFAGMALAIGAAIYLAGGVLIAVVAVGLALAGGGGAGFLIAAGAHAAYTRHLGVNVTQTYAAPPSAGPSVRPFVPSSAGPRTVRAGRFQLPAATWSALFAAAEANGGRLTRDGAARVLPRDLYRNWQATIGELQRLGMVDGDGQVTAGGWEFARRDVLPLPHDGDELMSAPSTHARRTHAAHNGQGVGQ